MAGRPASYFIVTYGCQMNVHDSETLTGMLENMGLSAAADRTCADFVIFNTCCVRDNAERRALGNVTWLKELKKTNPQLRVAVCGCMIQEPGMAEQILRTYPFVDLAFGTHNLYHFPTLFEQMVLKQRRVIEVVPDDLGTVPEDLPIVRSNPYQAYITIMYGCNNFCSYCIVPSVRGRERSRDSERILREAEALYRDGVKEIMLLGQNVNSYGLDRPEGMNFPKLLAAIDEIGIERIRFMTSHPKDLSPELMDVMAGSRHICPQLHLPVQHGNNRILKSMNRRYTREIYLEKVAMLRERIKNISLSTDIIVAYPGETEQEFRDTCSLVEQVRYDSAFTFIYSPRTGTPAAKMPDQVDPETASRRIQELIAIQKRITSENFEHYIGQTHHVLVDAPSRRDIHQMSGKNEYNITVNFDGSPDMIGSILPVRITEARETTLRGTLVQA
ncbi:MAG: tRNA (N6-isopentenyl adenosine(37)-C2)-methylthiotransferase MiaB [Clostridia bacterium]|nr:tRNA (N6-isopentenyl adenosine(37)-C2)-methylthiotransferase MiaB [Clostridia bacterium]